MVHITNTKQQQAAYLDTILNLSGYYWRNKMASEGLIKDNAESVEISENGIFEADT